jgi:hypothetical protein
MISIVNGYVCTSSCEAATVRAGKDPHALPGTPPGVSDKLGKGRLAGQPATIPDGAFAAQPQGAMPANDASPPLLNRLA